MLNFAYKLFTLHIVKWFIIETCIVAGFTYCFICGFFLTKQDIGIHSNLYVIPPPIYLPSLFSTFNDTTAYSSEAFPYSWLFTQIVSSPDSYDHIANSFRLWELDILSNNTHPLHTCYSKASNKNEKTTEILLEDLGDFLMNFSLCRIHQHIQEKHGNEGSHTEKSLLKTPKKKLDIWELQDTIAPVCHLLYRQHDFNKMIWILIDGLRFDFIEPVQELHPDKLYINHLQFVNEQLNGTDQNNARLYQFIADPPTATMQRLKGLVSGTLPTFIEISNSFGGTEMTEDHLLNQLHETKYLGHCNGISQMNQSIVVLGDDTWIYLFNKTIHRQYPFPSFDIHDLNTVDNGIKSYIWDELKRDDWILIVGHFLGIDHVGHKHFVNHPAMKMKLIEYNQFLKQIETEFLTSNKWDNTALVVFGDHGQSSDGAHGGAMPDEVTSGLFIYSPYKPFINLHTLKNQLTSVLAQLTYSMSPFNSFHNELLWKQRVQSVFSRYPVVTNQTDQQSSLYRSVPQVDFVPTVAFSLGIPVPFSNVGSIIPDSFLSTGKGPLSDLALITRRQFHNAVVMHWYVEAYYTVTGNHIFQHEILINQWKQLHFIYKKLWKFIWINRDNHETPVIQSSIITLLLQLWDMSQQYQLDVFNLCRDQWTRFKMIPLIIGILGTIGITTFTVIHSYPINTYNSLHIPEYSLIGILCGGLFSDCFSMRESSIVRFLFTSYVLLNGIIFLINTFPTIVHLYHPKTFFQCMYVCIQTPQLSIGIFIACITRLSVLFDLLEAIPGDIPTPFIIDSLFVTLSGIIIILSFTLWVFKCHLQHSLPSQLNKYIALFLWISLSCLTSLVFFLESDFKINHSNDNHTQSHIGKEQHSIVTASILLTRLLFLISISGIVWFYIQLRLNLNKCHYYNIQCMILIIILTSIWPLWIILGSQQTIPLLLICLLYLLVRQLCSLCFLNELQITCTLLLVSFVSFYNLGHRQNFNAIPISAGFVGLTGFHSIVSIILVFCHTYWVFIWGILISLTIKQKQKDIPYQYLFKNIIFSYHLILSLRFISSQIALFILRRHLMIWSVFAPKFIYDILGMTLTRFMSLLILELISRH